MSKIATIMTTFTRKARQWLFIALLALFTFSCNQESNIEIVDPDTKSSFDSSLREALGAMDTNPDQAIAILDGVVADANAIGSKYYSGKAKWFQGYIYDDITGDVSLAYRSYSEALLDILQTDDSSLKVDIYNNLGVLYRFYGQHDAAINNYEAALALKDELTEEQLSDIYYNYGVALKLKGDSISFYKAEDAFTQSLEYAKQIGYHENIASVYNQIGLMYKAIENYEMARIAYDNTINTYVNDPDLSEFVGMAHHGIGVTYMDEGNGEAAIRAFEKALEFKERSGSIFVTKYDLGTVLMQNDRVEEAITTWRDALSERHDKNSIEQVQIYSDLTSALKANNQYEEALGYSEIYNSTVQEILKEGEKYKSQSDQVLFANIVNEYDEFNKPVPFFSRPLVILASILFIVGLVYAIVMLYYRSKSKRKISEVVSKIQTEFMDIKVE